MTEETPNESEVPEEICRSRTISGRTVGRKDGERGGLDCSEREQLKGETEQISDLFIPSVDYQQLQHSGACCGSLAPVQYSALSFAVMTRLVVHSSLKF